jgi:membrane-associated phospholipid phosphatase
MASGTPLAVSACLLWAASAVAEVPPSPQMRSFGAADAVVTGASLGWAAYQRLRPSGSWSCRWCDSRDGRDTLWSVDRRVRDALRWRDRNKADRISNALLGTSFLVPVAFFGTSGQTAALNDGALVAESTVVTMALAQTSKKFFHRPRPFVHRGDPPLGSDPNAEGSHGSFFSGHASTTFALAVSTGTIALLRNQKNAGWALGTGLTIAATTSYLRIAAERHYFSDVVVGALVGSAVGWLVPHLHRPSSASAPATPASSPAGRSAPSFTLPVAGTAFAGPRRLGGTVAIGAGIGRGAASFNLSWTR